MDIAVGDVLIMKKNHPCGDNRFLVLRVGMDFKLKCEKCGHEMMLPRSKAEKGVKRVEKNGSVVRGPKSGEERPSTKG